MTDFLNEVKKIEKQIESKGYDEKAQQNFLKLWQKLGRKN
jgi:uncharacterized protein (UPF0335 family)